MNFSCDNCQRRYSIADDRVRGRTVRIRCRGCQSSISVTGPAVGAAEAPRDDVRPQWWAMLQGRQSGPFDPGALREQVRDGALTGRTFVWRKGMADWKRAGELPELARLFRDAVPVAVAKEPPPPRQEDPFRALGAIDPSELPDPRESTAFFIAQAGVNKRNPPWKIAAFVGSGLAVVVALFAVLSSLEVVPLTVTRTDADGHSVEQPVFSKESVTGLGSLLLGRKDAPAPQSAPRGPSSTSGSKRSVPPKVEAPNHDELAALYGDARKASVGPKIRRDVEEVAKDSSEGPSEESIAKVVSQSSSAFQLCIEQALRKNPNLRIPKFHVVATVAASGVVTRARIDRRELDGSSLGECLKSRAKRMVFSRFSGDEVDIEIPLIVGVAM